jgi:hypothetical protein
MRPNSFHLASVSSRVTCAITGKTKQTAAKIGKSWVIQNNPLILSFRAFPGSS